MSFHAPLMTCLYLHQLAQTQSGCCVLSNHAYLWIWGSCTSGVELKQGTEKNCLYLRFLILDILDRVLDRLVTESELSR